MMRTLSYDDFSSKVHAGTSKKRIPLNATLEVTYRCNNKCVHCYCNLPAYDEKAMKEELTTDEIKKLLDDLAAMGSLWLLITGGEPLLRPDFEEIYRHAKRKGFLITLFTNGTLIDEKITKLLSKYQPFCVEITLYGATKDIYEKITRVQDSYDKCLAGIKKIVNSNIKLELKTMALTINLHEIKAIEKMAESFGCEFRFDPVLHKRIDDNAGFSEPERYRISPEDVVTLDKMFPKRMEGWKVFCDKFVKLPLKDDRLYSCGAGISLMHISPYGIAMGCSMMINDGFSIRDDKLRFIWNEAIPFVIKQTKNFSMPCDDCRLKNLCGQCTSWSIIEHTDIKKEVAYLCEIAKVRARNFEFIDP